MEANTTRGSNNTGVNYVSQEELKEKLEQVGIGKNTLNCIIFNPTKQNMRTARGDKQEKEGGYVEIAATVARSTEQFEIDMLNATVRLVDEKTAKRGKTVPKQKTTTQESEGPTI